MDPHTCKSEKNAFRRKAVRRAAALARSMDTCEYDDSLPYRYFLPNGSLVTHGTYTDVPGYSAPVSWTLSARRTLFDCSCNAQSGAEPALRC